jgi:AcrR family transcriptional regulator
LIEQPLNEKMPRSPAQFRALREGAQDRIERAALRVFARLGFRRATVRDVAAEAGVAQGLLYHYFRGKEALLRAVFERGARDVAASFAAAAQGATPRERLARLVRVTLDIVAEHRDYWRLHYVIRHDPEVLAALGADLDAWGDGVRATLERILADLGHPDAPARARVLFAAVDGVAQHFTLDPERYPRDAVADALVAVFAPTP